jgi:hypothetical protein
MQITQILQLNWEDTGWREIPEDGEYEHRHERRVGPFAFQVLAGWRLRVGFGTDPNKPNYFILQERLDYKFGTLELAKGHAELIIQQIINPEGEEALYALMRK